MKRIILFTLVSLCLQISKAQITLDHTYHGDFYITSVKLSVSGYKYAIIDLPNMKLDLYNTNHSLFKSITIPPVSGTIQGVDLITETLFDADNLIEFAVQTSSLPSGHRKFYVFKENGTQLMFRDSAQYVGNYGIVTFNNQNGVFSDGVGTKLKLIFYGVSNVIKTEIYNLPGSIPCDECSSSGTITGIPASGNKNSSGAVFYPNPVNDQLKLKYDLPKDYKTAEIKVYDLQGKPIDSYRVTNVFDSIYLPTSYNNGLYLYSLIVDDKVIKTEKIMLNK